MKKSSEPMSMLTFLRLCLSGAIAGVAVTGIVVTSFQIDAPNLKDLVGGVMGAGFVACLKLSHFI
jgi:hypothetical protein